MPSGLFHEQRVPEKVHRRDLTAKVRKRRICVDDRNYAPIPFTIPGAVAVGDYDPAWPVDRDYWVAKVTASVGTHKTGTHPSDGTPGGQALKAQIRVVSADGNTDSALLSSDNVLVISADSHKDDIVSGLDEWTEGKLNQTILTTGETIYVKVTQVGTTRPGSHLVVTVWLVPVRFTD